MYVFGGREEQRILNDLWVVDLETYQWQQLKPNRPHGSSSFALEDYPAERCGHSCDRISHYMVIFGGFMNLRKELNDLFLFDFITHTWIKMCEDVNRSASLGATLRL